MRAFHALEPHRAGVLRAWAVRHEGVFQVFGTALQATEAAPGKGLLDVAAGIDVTNVSTLSPALFKDAAHVRHTIASPFCHAWEHTDVRVRMPLRKLARDPQWCERRTVCS
jgi:hypothetical protein